MTNSDLTDKADRSEIPDVSTLLAKKMTYYGSSSATTFLVTYRSVHNSTTSGNAQLVRMRSTDVAAISGLFMKWDTNVSMLIGVTQGSKVTAYMTVDGGVSVSKINAFA